MSKSSPRAIDIFSPARRDLLRDWLVSRTGIKAEVASTQIARFASGVDDLELIQALIQHKVTATLSEVYLSRLLRGVRKLADRSEEDRIGLCRAGALTLVAKGLCQAAARQGKDQMLAAQTIGAIWSLGVSPAVRERFDNSAVQAVLLTLIRSCIAQPYIVYQSLGSLRTLATNRKICEQLLQQPQQGGNSNNSSTWDLVLDCMEAHSGERDVQYLGLAALWTFALNNNHSSNSALPPQTGPAQEVTVAPPPVPLHMLSLVPWVMGCCFPDDRDIQHQGCGLLNALSFNSPSTRQALIAQRACAVVSQALQAFPNDLEVVKQSSGAVWILASNNAPAKAAFHACSTCCYLARALDAFADMDGEAVGQVCGALSTLLSGSGGVGCEGGGGAGLLLQPKQLVDAESLSAAWRGVVKCLVVGRWSTDVARLASLTMVHLSGLEADGSSTTGSISLDPRVAVERLGAAICHLKAWSQSPSSWRDDAEGVGIVTNLLEVTQRLVASGGESQRYYYRQAGISCQAIPVVMQAAATTTSTSKAGEDLTLLSKGLLALQALLGGGQQETGLTVAAVTGGDSTDAWSAFLPILTRVMGAQSQPQQPALPPASSSSGMNIVLACLCCLQSLCGIGGMRARLLEGKGQQVVQVLLDNLRAPVYGDDDATIAALRLLTCLAGGSDKLKEVIRVRALQFAFLTLQRYERESSVFSSLSLEIVGLLASSGASQDSAIKARLIDKALTLHGDNDRLVALHGAAAVVALAGRSEVSRSHFLGASALAIIERLFRLYRSDGEVAESLLLAATTLSPGWDQYPEHQHEVITLLEPSAPDSPIIMAPPIPPSSSFTFDAPLSPPPPIITQTTNLGPLTSSSSLGSVPNGTKRKSQSDSPPNSPSYLANPFTPPNNNVMMFGGGGATASGGTPSTSTRQWDDLFAGLAIDDTSTVAEAKDCAPPTASLEPVTRQERKASLTMDESKLCVVCIEEMATHALLPCGHRCVCATHGQLLASTNKECPMCRTHITSAVRIFVM